MVGYIKEENWMNTYDKQFENIMNETTLLKKMFSLVCAHPEDEDEILEAFSKQDNKVIHYELHELGDWMTEY